MLRFAKTDGVGPVPYKNNRRRSLSLIKVSLGLKWLQSSSAVCFEKEAPPRSGSDWLSGDTPLAEMDWILLNWILSLFF
ncbi:MAG: hypothetical protein AUF79_11255 [Crenarchaeota archaeon 13_1_20CM_2_51_8]|nr:MAG: hypothetical protein AUF79_11255 [Crenarchaeota archaeon 13_1_20CM_2_51_8]